MPLDMPVALQFTLLLELELTSALTFVIMSLYNAIHISSSLELSYGQSHCMALSMALTMPALTMAVAVT